MDTNLRPTPDAERTPGSLHPDGCAADLPGCIRREMQKIRDEDECLMPGEEPTPPECCETLAWNRWAKRHTGQELSDAVITVMVHCVKDGTTLHALLAEAARRLRHNKQISNPGYMPARPK